MFDSGNIVVTGGRSVEDVDKAYRQVVTYFEDYKLGDELYTLDEKHKRTRETTEPSKKQKKTKT